MEHDLITKCQNQKKNPDRLKILDAAVTYKAITTISISSAEPLVTVGCYFGQRMNGTP